MKNIKLLLATTAILSMELTLVANATYEGDPTGAATIEARAEFTSPIRVGSEPIWFGLLDPVIGGDVIVPADSGSSASGAAILGSGSAAPMPGAILLYGGAISAAIDATNGVRDGETGYVVFDDLYNRTITLIEEGSITSENPTGITCGTVTSFTEGGYIISEGLIYEGISHPVKGLQINIGATLTITPGYNPSGYKARCEGSTTVTYLLNPDY